MGSYYHHSSNGFSRRSPIIMQIPLVMIIIMMMMLSSKFGVGCPAEEYEALLEFKASCNGTSPPSWGKLQRDCCRWEGVTCSNSTERVTELHLSDLFWSYHPEGDWNQYDAQSWQLNLSIFSSFRELRLLDLFLNPFTGVLASTGALGGLKKLKELNLRANQLTGEILTSLGYLTSLEHLDLSENYLNTSQSLKALGGLKKLKELDLGGNQLIGEILTSLGYLTSLEHLDLSENYLNTSQSLKALVGLKKLRVLDLRMNRFEGEIPTSLRYLTSLEVLYLGSNNLNASLSLEALAGLKKLQMLDLSENQLIGEIPMSLGYLVSLEVLDLSYNNLTGPLPLKGDGRRTNFWTDIWIGHVPLRTCFPSIANRISSQGRRVFDCLGPNGWKWDVILRGFSPTVQSGRDAVDQLMAFLSSVSTSPLISDTIKWRWTASEVFSVNSLYKFLQFKGVHVTSFRFLWKNPIPLKVKIFTWLVLRYKVLTRDNLSRRGWSGDPGCVMCSAANETADHLFVTCKTARDLTGCRVMDKRWFSSCTSLRQEWEVGCIRGAFGRSGPIVLASIWWSIWLERNRRIFQNEKRPVSALLSSSRSLFADWLAFC